MPSGSTSPRPEPSAERFLVALVFDAVEPCEEVFSTDASAAGVLISCGGLLLTLDAIGMGVPVVSSSAAGFWDLMKTAGHDSRATGQGRLFEH